MGKSEELPLLGVEEFLREVEDIRQSITSHEKNLEKMNNIQDKLLKQICTPGERERLSSDLKGLGTENKELRQSIKEVTEGQVRKNTANISFPLIDKLLLPI